MWEAPVCFNLNAPSEADAVKRSEGMQTMQTKEHFSTWIHEKPAVMRRYEAVMALTVFFLQRELNKSHVVTTKPFPRLCSSDIF